MRKISNNKTSHRQQPSPLGATLTRKMTPNPSQPPPANMVSFAESLLGWKLEPKQRELLTGPNPATDTLYWATDPWPDLDDRDRPGDNLYTNCVLALEWMF